MTPCEGLRGSGEQRRSCSPRATGSREGAGRAAAAPARLPRKLVIWLAHLFQPTLDSPPGFLHEPSEHPACHLGYRCHEDLPWALSARSGVSVAVAAWALAWGHGGQRRWAMTCGASTARELAAVCRRRGARRW